KPDQSPEQVARGYVEPNKGVMDAAAALGGARAFLVERFSEDAALIGGLREEVWVRGRLSSQVRKGKMEPGAKFSDYFEFSEPLAKLPSHRILALFRGEKEDVLTLELVPDPAGADRGEPSTFERTDMPFWVNLPLDAALKAKVDAPNAIGGGVAPKGVA